MKIGRVQLGTFLLYRAKSGKLVVGFEPFRITWPKLHNPAQLLQGLIFFFSFFFLPSLKKKNKRYKFIVFFFPLNLDIVSLLSRHYIPLINIIIILSKGKKKMHYLLFNPLKWSFAPKPSSENWY